MLTRDARYFAAITAGGDGAALSHTPAARFLGLDRSRGVGTIHLSVPRHNHRRPSGIIVHRCGSLSQRDLTTRFGILTTNVEKTLLDQAAHLSPAQLRNQFERAEYLEILDRARLNALLTGAAGRKGAGNLRTLAGYVPLPLSRVRSNLEKIILTTCRTFSLPLPGVNVPLLDYEVDFFWPEARFVVEADGGQHRGEQRARDNERDLALQRAGHLVRRYSEEAVADKSAVAREIRAILDERLTR